MANAPKQTPSQTRSDSEIDFVLRRAKWRQGPEVLRDLAGGEAATPERRPRGAKKAASRPRAKKR